MYEIWNRMQYMLSPQFDIYEKVSEVVSGNVLDVGSGTGLGTHLLARNAKMVVGYEVDERAYEFAQRAFGNGNLHFYNADILTTQVAFRQYDFVTMIDVIEHIENDLLAIKRCRELLFSGGTFICSTPNKMSRYRKSENHVREYIPGEFLSLLIKVFNKVEINDYQLNPHKTEYVNPMVAICS